MRPLFRAIDEKNTKTPIRRCAPPSPADGGRHEFSRDPAHARTLWACNSLHTRHDAFQFRNSTFVGRFGGAARRCAAGGRLPLALATGPLAVGAALARIRAVIGVVAGVVVAV